jgi:hypothetical protein
MLLLGVVQAQASGGGIEPPAFLATAPLWLDAADTSTITESGGSVSQWDNKGTLENIVQGNAALQPTTGVSTLNGLNVIDFASDLMQGQTISNWKFLHDGTKYFMTAVVKFGVTSNPDAFYGLIGTNRASSANVGATFFYDDRAGDSESDTWRFFIARGVSGSNVANIGQDDFYTANNFLISSALVSPAESTAADRIDYFVNDTQGSVTNAANNTPSTANPSYIMQVGSTGDSVGALVGSLAELILVSGTDATEENRALTVEYLNAKWGAF